MHMDVFEFHYDQKGLLKVQTVLQSAAMNKQSSTAG